METPRRTLSSRLTFVAKFVVPVLSLGTFVLIAILAARDSASRDYPIMVPVLLLLAAAFGVYVYTYWIQLKRVELAGDRLYVSNFRDEAAIRLEDVDEVRQLRWIDPRPIRITFRRDTDFGTAIIFAPPRRHRFRFWREDPEVEELRRAVEQARRRATSWRDGVTG